MTIAEMKPGDRARMKGWMIDDPPARLLEMGLLPGTEIELVRYAPLGDPIDIRIRGYHLSLRKSEASQIEIEMLA